MSHNGALKGGERRSPSECSLLTMHPVASGDNVATQLRSAHRLKDEAPSLVPCCEGTELQVNEDLIRTGLSAISVKHESVLDCISQTQALSELPLSSSGLGLVKHRNSFRSLHRPDLRRVPCLRKMAPKELESLFKAFKPEDLRKNTDPLTNAENAPEPAGEECVRVMLPTSDEQPARRPDLPLEPSNGGRAGSGTLPISKGGGAAASSVMSASLPSGMRLHGARARLYTSVQAAARGPPGDRPRGSSLAECGLDAEPAGGAPRGELHIILPPRPEDQLPSEPSTTSELR